MVCWHISWWKRRINRGQISECKKQGWSINIYSRVFKIFCISEEICKKLTETSNKIDGKLVSKTVLEDTGALENLSKFKSHINYADIEVTKDHLYIKTRTFSLVKSRMDAHKLLLWKYKARSLRTAIRKWWDTLSSSWNLIRRIQNQLLTGTLKSSCFYSSK